MAENNKDKHYLGHRKRLKKKLVDNPESLDDYEILELILGYAMPRRDTKPQAKAILNEFGSLRGALAASGNDLKKIPGIGKGISTFWILWREFWTRSEQSGLPPKETLDSPEKVARLARSRINFLRSEEFWVILVDNKNRLLSFERVSRGTVDQATVYPRTIISRALALEAGGLILAHNHPGGDPQPSTQDIELTKKVKQISEGLNLRV
ncbi:MAG: RadC family protein, partial [Desulfonatronovibrionaceae bacterium]